MTGDSKRTQQHILSDLTPYLIGPGLVDDISRAVREAKSRFYNFKLNKRYVSSIYDTGLKESMVKSINDRKDQIFTLSLDQVYTFIKSRCSGAYKKLLIDPNTLVDTVSPDVLDDKIAAAVDTLNNTESTDIGALRLDEKYLVAALVRLFVN